MCVEEKRGATTRGTQTIQPAHQKFEIIDGDKDFTDEKNTANQEDVSTSGVDAFQAAASTGSKGQQRTILHKVALNLADYEERDCGGKGDCAYLSIAAALADAAGETPSDHELSPGGELQADLRCKAAMELKANPGDYESFIVDSAVPRFAQQVSCAGYAADVVALIALAQAAKLELRIFAYDAKLQCWNLHTLTGLRPDSEPTSPTVLWLQLKDQHYRWLRPLQEKTLPEGAMDGAGSRRSCTTDAWAAAS